LKLALGTVQFGLPYGIANQVGQVSLAEAKSILKFAATSGIETLDTAISYGDSEQRLGQSGVQNWQIVSKLPVIPDDMVYPMLWIQDAVNSSLRNLNVSKLYGLLLHRPAQLLETRGDQIYLALQELKKAGLIEKIGISIYDPVELDNLYPHFHFDIIQVPFNIIDRRLIQSGWLNRLAKEGVELHARSVFLQGLLLMKSIDRPSKFNRWSSLFLRWDQWLSEVGLTALEASIRYALSFPEIKKVIVGVDSAKQLKELTEAAKGHLPEVHNELFSNDENLLNPANWVKL